VGFTINNTAVVMTLHNRPEYTSAVLAALLQCEGIEDLPVYLMCEPVNQAVIDVAKEFAAERSKLGQPCQVNVYTEPAGCNINTAYALATGFSVCDRVIALEDDTVPGRDFILFCQWALDTYEDDKSVFSVSGYQRTAEDELHRTDEVIRENWFTPWGWATWRDRYEEIYTPWPSRDDQISWDTVLHRGKLGDRCEIRPIVARIQNIGAEGGLHVPNAKWHAQHHLNEHWIETVYEEPTEEFLEVSADTTNGLRANHPC